MQGKYVEKILNIQIPLAEKSAKIFLYDTVQSVFDVAYVLANENRLDIWDSAIAKIQHAGRGQLRRKWYSPEGNIYACLRLPIEGEFKNIGATTFLGLLFCLALRKLGWPVLLKWPNDLVLMADNIPGKVGGILLEERGTILLAGIGINLSSAPDKELMRKDTALYSSCLKNYLNLSYIDIDPISLWIILLKQIISIYFNNQQLCIRWQNSFNNLLLWKDFNVIMEDGQNKIFGKLLGINHNGALQILSDDKVIEFYSGNLDIDRGV